MIYMLKIPKSDEKLSCFFKNTSVKCLERNFLMSSFGTFPFYTQVRYTLDERLKGLIKKSPSKKFTEKQVS
jgi:hypothetical protein